MSEKLGVDFKSIASIKAVENLPKIGNEPIKGEFDEFSKEIKISADEIKNAADLWKTVAHELGHALDMAIGGGEKFATEPADRGEDFMTADPAAMKVVDEFKKLTEGRRDYAKLSDKEKKYHNRDEELFANAFMEHATGGTTNKALDELLKGSASIPQYTKPTPVEIAKPPDPKPLPAAPPVVPAQPALPPTTPPEWLKSLISPDPGTNPHVLMEGQSGSGKSVATRHIAMERMRLGHDVHVLDPHTPESWGGAKQVFQGESAGTEAAKFMEDLLKSRIAERQDALNKGLRAPDFKPVSVVLSDFAAIAKNTPALQEIIKQMLTEGRKFNIAVLADTTALTGAESGIKGINNVLANFRQKARFYAPTDEDPQRRVRIGGTGGEQFPVPNLPDYKEKVDYSLVKPTSETGVAQEVGAAAMARRLFEQEKYKAEVEAKVDELRSQTAEGQLAAAKAARKAQVEIDDERQRLLELEARAALAAVRKQQAAAEAAIPTAEVAFDPKAEAQKRVDAERKREAIEDEYKKMKPQEFKKPKGAVDIGLDVAESMRGAIGGAFGSLAGAALDVTHGVRTGMKEAAAATELGDAAGAAAAKMGMLVPAVGAAVVAFGAITGALDESVKRYAEVSPVVAQAQAQAEIKNVLNDIRRGQEHGSELARYVRSQAEMQQKFEDAKMKLLVKLAPVIEAIFGTLGDIMDAVSVLGNLTSIFDVIAAPLNSIASSASESVSMQRDDRFPDAEDPTEVLFKNGKDGIQVPNK